MKSINQQLQNLYRQNWDVLSKEYLTQISDATLIKKPTNPLLLKIDEQKYQEADMKIMIFGQETNDWGGNFNGNIETPLETYNDFFNTGECFSYGGHFWNGFNKLKAMIGAKYPQRNIYYIWNNIVKIGKAGEKNAPSDYIYAAERKNLNVISKEIEIISPDAVVFFTGPDYDQKILNALPNASFGALSPGFTQRQLAKISALRPAKMYRTYHPNFLYRNNIESFLAPIVEDL